MKIQSKIRASASGLMVFFLYMLLPVWVMAETYYVSGIGDDANDGLSEATAWQTIEKVNASTSSNATVLFRRGDIFRGRLELEGTKTYVTFGAYGTGENPVISGSKEIAGWAKYKGDIWVADVSAIPHVMSDGIRHLFVDGELMRIARHPDAGWLRVGETDTNTKKKIQGPCSGNIQQT